MNPDRRRFLALGAAAAAATLLDGCNSFGPSWAPPLLRYVERRNEGVERWLLRSGRENGIPTRAQLTGRAFPRYHIARHTPMWDAAARGPWHLEVSGAVWRPLSLTLEELARLPSITQRVDHFCVEGWTARARWTGVRVSELARVAGATADAHYVDFQSFDEDFHESWDMQSAMHPQTLVAYGMDGAYLGPGHGAPARVHSPIKLGYKNTKYLTRIVFLPARNGGYWSDRGYEWFGGV
jgi:DMSO/TMAO reductase YedYZ molybdopterin-dependent catalytic subunit